MDPLTASILIVAALLHASWHALVKAGDDQLVNLVGMGLVAAIPTAAAIPFLPLPPPDTIPILVSSIVLHGAYKICIAYAYARADLAQAFPLARGCVPVFATVLAFAALGQVPTMGESVGTLLIALGIISLAVDKRAAHPSAIAAAVGAGLAVAGYSVLDAYGTRVYGNWAGFTAWLVFSDSAVFLAFGCAIRGRRIWPSLIRMRARVAVSGLLGIIAFAAFLWAISQSPAGASAALRETSILFAMLIGALINRERLGFRRALSGALILAGIASITL